MSKKSIDYTIPQKYRVSSIYAHKSLQPCFVRSTLNNNKGITEMEDMCHSTRLLGHALSHRAAVVCLNKIREQQQDEFFKQFASKVSTPLTHVRTETAPTIDFSQQSTNFNLRPETALENNRLLSVTNNTKRPFTAHQKSTTSLRQEIILAHHDYLSQPKLELNKLFKQLKRITSANSQKRMSNPGETFEMATLTNIKTPVHNKNTDNLTFTIREGDQIISQYLPDGHLNSTTQINSIFLILPNLKRNNEKL